MSVDRKTTTDLIETLRDGEKGFDHAAERLESTDRPDLATKFRTYARQRKAMADQLETMAASYGDDIDESGSVAAAVHRGWITVKDAISGSSPSGVLDAAEQGEDHAVAEFDKALKQEISIDLRDVVTKQFDQVKSTQHEVSVLRKTLS